MIKLNNVIIVPTLFPDKTSQVWRLPQEVFSKDHADHACIEWTFESEGEFMALAQLKDLTDSMGLKHNSHLHLMYLPYGRQDKPVSNETTFALHTFAKLLNALEFHVVTADDPHSIEAAKLIHNFRPLYPTEEIDAAYDVTRADLVCFPDAGARTKYDDLLGLPSTYGEKVREQSTGKILSYDLKIDGRQIKGENVLIVDDICDGGATFILLADALIAEGAKAVHLFVSHGIFSKGTQVLKDAGIQRIFTIKGEVK